MSDPTTVLLCCVEGEPNEGDVRLMSRIASVVGERRSWALSPPQFVNEGPIGDRTVGVALSIPSATGVGDVLFDREVEVRALADVEALIEAAVEATAASDAEVAFELDGGIVGWVSAGVADRMLLDGLLGPWRLRVAGGE